MNFDPLEAAIYLDCASRTGLRIRDLPPEARPSSLTEGYAVQSLFVERMNEEIVGWKIAGASPRGLRGELPAAPAHGCLTASRVLASGAALTFPSNTCVTLETEVAFRFGRTVSPAEENFDPASMIEHAFVAIEVVCSRYIDRRAVDQPSFVADNLGFHALICGEQIEVSARFFEAEAGIWRNGERIAESLSGDERTRPFDSLAFLWSVLARQRKTISEGAIATTGTLSAPVDTDCSGSVRAQIAAVKAEVTLRCLGERGEHSRPPHVRHASASDWMDTAAPFQQAEF